MAKGIKTGGRKPHTPNKVPRALKEMILDALHEEGGTAWLRTQMADNPGPFMTLLGKTLPLTVAGDQDNPLKIETIERRIVHPKD